MLYDWSRVLYSKYIRVSIKYIWIKAIKTKISWIIVPSQRAVRDSVVIPAVQAPAFQMEIISNS